jgi:hypothetical protein
MSKLSILNENNEAIVGILEKKPDIDEGRPQPRIVLIVHGILGWFEITFFSILGILTHNYYYM